MTEEELGEAWRKLAKDELHVPGVPLVRAKTGGNPKGMSHSERRALSLLEVQHMTTGELAQELGLDVSTVRGVCRGLATRGKVRRVDLVSMPNGGLTAVWGRA